MPGQESRRVVGGESFVLVVWPEWLCRDALQGAVLQHDAGAALHLNRGSPTERVWLRESHGVGAAGSWRLKFQERLSQGYVSWVVKATKQGIWQAIHQMQCREGSV